MNNYVTYSVSKFLYQKNKVCPKIQYNYCNNNSLIIILCLEPEETWIEGRLQL